MLQIGKKRESGITGLEIEAGSVAAVEVRGGNSPQLGATAIAPLSPEAFQDGEVSNPELLAETLEELFSVNKLSKRVRLGVANQRVVVRTLRLPAIDDPKELDAAVRFQAQEQVPMPIDQAVLDHRVVGGIPATDDGPAQIDVIVVAARRDMIAASLAPLREAGLEPIGVDLSAFGLIRALAGEAVAPEVNAAGEEGPAASLYCNIGDVTNLAVAKGRSCLFTRISPFGMDDILSGLMNTASLTQEHARMWIDHVGLEQPTETIEGDPGLVASVRTSLEDSASSLRDELRLSLDFYGAQEGSLPVQQVLLCGAGSVVPGLAAHLEVALGLPFSVARPKALTSLDTPSAARLSLPFGLALDE